MVCLGLWVLLSRVQPTSIESQLAAIEAKAKGKLGVAIIRPGSAVYLHKNDRFAVESVMKMVVSMAVLEEVDKGRWTLDQPILFRRTDLSVSVQPLAELLGKRDRMNVTLRKCIDLTVTQSCSASGDFMVRKLGGISKINAFLRRHGITGMSIDRQERDLQTGVIGLKWKDAYLDPRAFDADVARTPKSVQDAAFKRYLKETRDTTTPAAMGDLLLKLVTGKLLSAKSTAFLLGVMERTETGADRLTAGVPSGWKLAHKTGTSRTWQGVNCATNDVGVVRNSKGEWVVLVALLRGSTASSEDRAAALAGVARVALGGR
jgi:beta-lactamase class A